MDEDQHHRDGETLRALEAFSRDLLGLVRAVRVYPAGHRFLQELAGRLGSAVGRDLPEPLAVGVTSRELTVGSHFAGGKDTRASELAVFLHGRKVLRVTWGREAKEPDIIGFAEILADPRTQGAQVQEDLRRRKIYGIEVVPLSVERIHDLFREAPRLEPGDSRIRGQEAWLWLLNEEVSPGQIADILAADIYWEAGTETALLDAAELTGILARLGERLGAALDCLPGDQRSKVVNRLARAGRQVSPEALARILQTADSAGVLQGPMSDALEETFGGDKLVDLLAGLVAQEGRNTRRLAEVYGRFGRGRTSELLPAVRERLASTEKGGFTVEVWDAVEEFLLARREDPYMDAEYSASLESLAAEGPPVREACEDLDFSQDLEEHSDRLLVGLVSNDPAGWGTALLDRLEARLAELRPEALLERLRDVERVASGLLDSDPALLERAFRLCLDRLKNLDSSGRQMLSGFARAHETALLGAVLRLLEEERTQTARKFLVEVLAGFSPASTPALVTRLRSAPWYVARNLTVALGKRREAVVIPLFRSLVGHAHPKVRREAILALGQFDSPSGRETLAEVASRPTSTPEERELAERALKAPRLDAGTS